VNVFTAFLLTLIKPTYEETEQQQAAFYADPHALMDNFRHNGDRLTPRQMSIICSLVPSRILEEAKKDTALPVDFETNLTNFVRSINNDNDWPEQGDIERDPWLNPANPCNDPPGPAPADGRMGIFWSAPHAQILWVFKRSARLEETFDLKITGEGLLPHARVMLVCRNADTPYVIAEDATEYRACNIRRTYILAPITIPKTAPTGEYNLYVINRGWRHTLEWGSNFRINP